MASLSKLWSGPEQAHHMELHCHHSTTIQYRLTILALDMLINENAIIWQYSIIPQQQQKMFLVTFLFFKFSVQVVFWKVWFWDWKCITVCFNFNSSKSEPAFDSFGHKATYFVATLYHCCLYILEYRFKSQYVGKWHSCNDSCTFNSPS